MLIRVVESTPPIERITETERDAGAAEHEKRGDKVRRLTRQHGQRESTDQWCGSRGEEAEDEHPHEQKNYPVVVTGTKKNKLDYRA